MTGLTWVLMSWAVVGGGVVLWLRNAMTLLEGSGGRRPGPTDCACCRHDQLAHRDGAGTGCTQCPCPALRLTCPDRMMAALRRGSGRGDDDRGDRLHHGQRLVEDARR